MYLSAQKGRMSSEVEFAREKQKVESMLPKVRPKVPTPIFQRELHP